MYVLVSITKQLIILLETNGWPETIIGCDKWRVEEGMQHLGSAQERDDEEDVKSIGARHISGGESYILRGHHGPVFDVAFSHKSSHLFSVGEDATMRLWDLTNKPCYPLAFYKGHSYPIWCLSVSAQSLYIATGSYDQTVRVWTTECTFPIRTMIGHTDAVDCLDFHPNCTYIASGSNDHSIRLWQINDGAVARILCQHQFSIRALAFAPNGK